MDISANGQQIIDGFGPQAGIVILGLLVALGVVIREWRRRETVHDNRLVDMQKLYLKMMQTMMETHNETNNILRALDTKLDENTQIRDAITRHLTRKLEEDS